MAVRILVRILAQAHLWQRRATHRDSGYSLTGKIDHFPVILYGRDYWRPLFEWIETTVAAEKMISPVDMALFRVTDDLDEILNLIDKSFLEADAAARAAEASPTGEEPVDAEREREQQLTRHPE